MFLSLLFVITLYSRHTCILSVAFIELPAFYKMGLGRGGSAMPHSQPKCTQVLSVGRNSSVGTATRYGLDGLGIESW